MSNGMGIQNAVSVCVFSQVSPVMWKENLIAQHIE
jgi:hypothetical protein